MIDKIRAEVYDYFKRDLAPLIRNGIEPFKIEKKAQDAFSRKYEIKAKKYKESIRVSFNLKSNGIIYFVAETNSGEADFPFLEPSYLWRNFVV